MFYQPQYLQDVQGRSAIAAGLLILPITVPMVFFSPLSGRLIARFGARELMSAGMLCGLGGVLVLTRVEVDSPYALLLAGYLLFGIALGLVYAPMSTAAMAAMPAEKAGIASGVLAMDRVLAGAIGLAATGAVFHALQVGGDPFSDALAGSTWVPVGLCALGAMLTWAYVRDPDPPGPDPCVAGGPAHAAGHHQHHRTSTSSAPGRLPKNRAHPSLERTRARSGGAALTPAWSESAWSEAGGRGSVILLERKCSDRRGERGPQCLPQARGLTNPIPSCPHGIRAAPHWNRVCHHRRDVVDARG